MHIKVSQQKFDTQIAINDCTVNELIFSIYEAGLLNITIKNPKLTTSELKLLLGKGIVDTFGANQLCSMTVTPAGDSAP